jgi:broad specificity phosphatase PhoE
MQIDFIRHGKTQTDVVIGRSNAPLIKEGIAETKKALLKLALNYEELYSSDLLKCVQTAEILNKKLHLPIQFDSRLREVHFGSLAGKRFSDIDPTGELEHQYKKQEYNFIPYGGESVENVQQRVVAFVENITRHSKSTKILVVTHGGIIRLLSALYHTKAQERIDNSAIYQFEFS